MSEIKGRRLSDRDFYFNASCCNCSFNQVAFSCIKHVVRCECRLHFRLYSLLTEVFRHTVRSNELWFRKQQFKIAAPCRPFATPHRGAGWRQCPGRADLERPTESFRPGLRPKHQGVYPITNSYVGTTYPPLDG